MTTRRALYAGLVREIHRHGPRCADPLRARMGQHGRLTKGKCMVIIGAGVNHWYHGNLMYRAAIHALMFCGCVGVNGGGLAHYVGQEKLAPMEPWSAIAFARDWIQPPGFRMRRAGTTSTPTSGATRKALPTTTPCRRQQPGSLAAGHTMDMQARAVRNGWLPFYPQFNAIRWKLVSEAEAAGAKTQEEINAMP